MISAAGMVPLGTAECITASLLFTVRTVGIMVNEVHNNPMDIGRNRFLTQGTVFPAITFCKCLTTGGLKRNAGTKYYAIVTSASNK